jgi:large subunit ribosomal protein L32
MAVPKKKKSRSKRDMRRSHDHVKMPNISLCPQCHEPVLPHHICLLGVVCVKDSDEKWRCGQTWWVMKGRYSIDSELRDG